MYKGQNPKRLVRNSIPAGTIKIRKREDGTISQNSRALRMNTTVNLMILSIWPRFRSIIFEIRLIPQTYSFMDFYFLIQIIFALFETEKNFSSPRFYRCDGIK